MPIYSYSCEDCGKTTDVIIPSSELRSETIDCQCGKKSKYDFAATFGRAGFTPSGDREYVSEALAVRPDEVKKTIEEDKKIGSMAKRYLPDGRLVFDSWSQKRKYERDRGYNE